MVQLTLDKLTERSTVSVVAVSVMPSSRIHSCRSTSPVDSWRHGTKLQTKPHQSSARWRHPTSVEKWTCHKPQIASPQSLRSRQPDLEISFTPTQRMIGVAALKISPSAQTPTNLLSVLGSNDRSEFGSGDSVERKSRGRT